MTAPDIAVVPQFNGDEKMDKSTELDVEDSYYLLHALGNHLLIVFFATVILVY